MASLPLDDPLYDPHITDEALTWPVRAAAAVVTDPDTYRLAAEMLLGVKALRSRIAETFDPHIQRAHLAHKNLLAEKAKAETPLTEAERIIKRSLADYDTAQEHHRQVEQRRLEAEARQRAEDELISLAAFMEREGAATGDDELVAEAHALVVAGPVDVVLGPIVKATPKVAGISHRVTYSAQVHDLLALVKFVAANPSHLALLTANMPALHGQARSLKEHLRIPGVVVVATRDVAAGR